MAAALADEPPISGRGHAGAAGRRPAAGDTDPRSLPHA
jgi:hypothetical protein